MDKPTATILICTHNGAATIAAAAESALDQATSTFDFEVVVVDDGSTDETAEIVGRIARADNRVKLGRFKFNEGLPVACNEGLRCAKGEFVIRIDDDDLLLPGAIEAMCPPLQYGMADWSYCDHFVVDTGTGTRRRFVVGPFPGIGWLARLSACGVMMRRDLLLKLGGYKTIFWHEYDLYLRYMERAAKPPAYVREPFYVCAGRPDGPTGASAKMREGWRELAAIWGENVLRKNGLGFVSALEMNIPN